MNNRLGDKYEKNMHIIKKINNSINIRAKLYTNLNNFHKLIKGTKPKNKNKKENINIEQTNKNIILKNINKYNSKTNQLNWIIINNLLRGKISHFKSLLKDNNLINNNTDYIKRYYKRKEINELLPKFHIYYKNYFKFFLKPTLSDFYYNDLLKENGNILAQNFYEKYKTKKVFKRNKIQKNPFYNKKILLSKIFEKNNNQSSINLSNENVVNSPNKIYSESSISLLSIINLINNNTSRNKLNKENDYIKKKINLFLDFKKDKKSNNKSQKSTAVFTPTNIHQTKTLKDFNSTKQIIKKDENINDNKSQKNTDKFICLSERNTIEKIYDKNKNIFIRNKVQSQKNKNLFRNNNFTMNLKNKIKEINNNHINNVEKEKIALYNNRNNTNKLFNNLKEAFYSQANQDMYQLTTQMTNRKSNFQTQIKKVLKKSPNFKNKINNNVERINSNSMKFNMSLSNSNSNRNINTVKTFYRNNFFSKSLIYYQKLKKEKKMS